MDFRLPPEVEQVGRTVRAWVDATCPKSRAHELEAREHEFPHELWEEMAKAGLHALGIDARFGGAGGDVLTQAVVARELARSLAGLTWVWGISSFAGGKSVGLYGTEGQRERFLPGLAAGTLRFAIAFTEPAGGTDLLGALRTRAARVSGGWVLNGRKVWSTAADVADHLLLLARSDPESRRTRGLTLFLVPQPVEGLELRRIPKIGMRAISSFEVFLDDVFVPDDLVLGEPGAAWGQLLGTLNNERIILAALCVGILDGVVEELLDWAAQPEHVAAARSQAFQHTLADIAVDRERSRLLVLDAAWRQSRGLPCGAEANVAKLVAAEAANGAADAGMQLVGQEGYASASPFQRYWRDSRIYRIAPIANEMVRNALAESYGLPRSF